MRPNIKGLSHDHMDGCFSNLMILKNLYQEAGKKFPFRSNKEMVHYFQTNAVRDITACFGNLIQVMQTETALRAVAQAYIEHRAGQGYVYLEPKIAPQYHIFEGLSMERVADIVFDELKKRASQLNINVTPAICIGREANPSVGIEIAKIALKYDGEMILDLACDEANHPPDKHFAAYKLTFGTKVKRDCHAGEWVSPRPRTNYQQRLLQNVRIAILNLCCDSVGHAIPLAHDEELIKYVADNDIRITMCPLSNKTLGHIQSVRDLEIKKLLNANVWLTLNPDDDLFLPDMDQVINECETYYNFTTEHRRKLEKNAIRPLIAINK